MKIFLNVYTYFLCYQIRFQKIEAQFYLLFMWMQDNEDQGVRGYRDEHTEVSGTVEGLCKTTD